MEEEQKKSIDNTSNVSLPSVKQDTQLSSNSLKAKTNPDSDTELSNSPKKQKKIEEITSTSTLSHDTLESKSSKTSIDIYHQDTSFNKKDVGYCNFSSTNKKSSEPISASNTKIESIQSNPIQQILNQASTLTTDLDIEEDEQQKKIIAAKKLLFPNALATSFSEVTDTLRNERRQEFCPIYKDETPEQILLRQEKQKPVGSLLAKRIHWDDLKRKREEEEKRNAQMQFRYGPYGPIYTNRQQPQQSFANPYEQYYATMQNQYEQMVQMTRAQQEHKGFWQYDQQLSVQNNSQITQNSMQQQIPPYTYPYPAMYSNYTSPDYNSYLNNLMQPPPPPPDEPYPY